MNEEKEPGKYPAIVGLGVIIAVLAVTLVFLNLAWKTGKLSPEKMRLAAEGTESVYEENQADYGEDTQVEELASFTVSVKSGVSPCRQDSLRSRRLLLRAVFLENCFV